MSNEIKIIGNVRKPSIYDPDLAQKIIEEERRKLELERKSVKKTVTGERAAAKSSVSEKKAINGNYVLMPKTSTYALGVEAIRESYKNGKCPSQPTFTKADGSRIVRPLTFRENIEARVNDYNTLNNVDGSERTEEERLRFFNRWLDSCTGIAYKKGTTNFKIVHQSLDLIEISYEFNENFLPIDYDSIDGVELDSKDAKYNDLLTLSQVKSYPAWLAAVKEDTALLSEYADIVFAVKKQEKAIGFYVRSNTEIDELRALFVDNINNYSDANGNYNLNFNGSFLLVAPSQKIP